MPSEIRLKGDWRKLRHLANELESVKDIDDTLMPEIADKVKEALEVAVGSNPPPANAESTLRKPYKRGKGTLQETGGFPDNIIVDETKERNRSVYLIRGSDTPQARGRRDTPPTYKELEVLKRIYLRGMFLEWLMVWWKGKSNTWLSTILRVCLDRRDLY